MLVIALDPGTTESAIVQWDGNELLGANMLPNADLLHFLRNRTLDGDELIACEGIQCFGMAVGKQVFDTCQMIGRIEEIAFSRNIRFQKVYRKDVKIHHCGTTKAKDGNIRQSLVDKYGETGTKKQPGRTYGLKSHLWQAFAIGTFITEKMLEQK